MELALIDQWILIYMVVHLKSSVASLLVEALLHSDHVMNNDLVTSQKATGSPQVQEEAQLY